MKPEVFATMFLVSFVLGFACLVSLLLGFFTAGVWYGN